MIERMRRYRIGIIWIILTVVFVVVVDWPIGLYGDWFSEHGLISDIVAGVLLLFVGLFFIEAWFTERQAKKWREVTNIASKEVGYMTFMILRGMDHLLSGRFSELHEIDIIRSYNKEVQRILGDHGLLMSTRPPVATHLRILLKDEEWVRLAIIVLDILKHEHRHHIAQWVGVMLTTDLMTNYINQAARINQTIFQIQDMLRIALNPEDARLTRPEIQHYAKDPDTLANAIITYWWTVDAKAKDLQQELMQAAGEEQWINPHSHHNKIER